MKYLNIFVLMTFLVGQIQFAYSSYYCTMKGSTVGFFSSSGKNKSMSCESMGNENESCDECAPMMDQLFSCETIQSNCMQVHVVQKMVVENFINVNKTSQHLSEFTPACIFVSILSNNLFTKSCKIFSSNYSPPIDTPTLLNNLRI